VQFTYNGATNKGAFPFGGLVQASDGNFYGTTQYGAASFFGTVFKMTATGMLTTLVQFDDNGTTNNGAHPSDALIKGSDNNLYGTTESGGTGGGGTVYRLRFGPTPVTLAATSVASTSATLQGTVNPNAVSTNVHFEYGISPTLAG